MTLHGAVVREDLARWTSLPTFVEDAVLPVDLEAAQPRVGRLRAQRAQRLALPLDDVRERVLREPALALDPRPGAEAGDLALQPAGTQAEYRAVQRAVLPLYFRTSRAL